MAKDMGSNWLGYYADSQTEFPIHYSTLDVDISIEQDGTISNSKYGGKKVSELAALEAYDAINVPQLLELGKTDNVKGLMNEFRQPIASGLDLIVLFEKPTKEGEIGFCSTLV